ncbi:MAG: acetylglutamate kinase [Elusimicrobia bacterium]|nr:acetylglutamate kinase [Elusimicrobiota bacterium]
MTDAPVTLYQAMPYLRLYKGKTFVVKAGGAVLAREELRAGLAADIACLHHFGIRVVLVHGGGPQATSLSKALGLETKLVAGRRVTDAETLEVVKMTCGGLVNMDLVAALRGQGVRAVGLSGVDAGLVVARKRGPVRVSPAPGEDPVEVDYGLVGDVETVDGALLEGFLSQGLLPVIAPLVADAQGQILNLNADTLSSAIAQALKAEKLLLLTDIDGVLRDAADPRTLVSHADAAEVLELCSEGRVRGGMLPKVQACVAALRGGVRRTHILGGMRRSALVTEVFTNAGCGTMIVESRERDAYQKELAKDAVAA